MASTKPLSSVHQQIRQSEALVYAVGSDWGGGSEPGRKQPPMLQRGPMPMPFPFPIPGGRRPFPGQPPPPQFPSTRDLRRCTDPVDVVALRDLTDDSGGRTEIIREPRDLNPATRRIADELRNQYYLGYPPAANKDGPWHTIHLPARHKPR